MSTSYRKPNPVVMIALQDQDAEGRVYIEIQGKLNAREMIVEAFRRLRNGLVYADSNCTSLIDDEYIEVYRKINGRKDEEGFVFLIDRSYADDYIVSARIIR